MEARQMGISLTPEERFEVFGENWVDEHEAYERWGETEAWAQSQRRTATYDKQAWLAIKADADDVERRLTAALADGVPAASEQAMDLAEEHRAHIGRYFYDCSPEMHAGLGRMYLEDERFTAHYERIAPGLAQYVSTAQANAVRLSG
ncbi:TipAS antibiotic-recognition domain-containing protein [Modestobacter sp. DSM 44400]|uniref:TipAS antibiotic-recognition domain-containing protein n=1 Tax=Modestobacter sp. DSM 44400 TaxID=1550230 RepID=UPI0020C9056E|nr:TipAS antibiotic-recognition domain-containing protein [Modestobacter sp. DSM 44400]